LRKQVLERDGYKCVKCGCDVLANLNIHHKDKGITGKRIDELDNLKLLCDACHKLTHYETFINRRKRITFTCLVCGKQFEKPQYRLGRTKYCSRKCKDKSQERR
jgi:DNA-directed RNA polymerase subunit RPC12/RpoP